MEDPMNTTTRRAVGIGLAAASITAVLAATAPQADAASRAHVSVTRNSQHYVLVSTCNRDRNSSCRMRVLYPGQTSPAGYYWVRVTPGYQAQRIGGHRTITAGHYQDSRFIGLSSQYGVFKTPR